MAPKNLYAHTSCLNYCITEFKLPVILKTIQDSVCKFVCTLIVSVRGMKEVTSMINNGKMRPTENIFEMCT